MVIEQRLGRWPLIAFHLSLVAALQIQQLFLDLRIQVLLFQRIFDSCLFDLIRRKLVLNENLFSIKNLISTKL